MDSTPRQA